MHRGPIRWRAAGVVVLCGGVGGVVSLSAAAPARPRSCPHPTVPVPPHEPVYSSGPTGLVSGLYVVGGPLPPPPCKPQPHGPFAGTVRVTHPSSGALVARQTVRDGRLAHIRLAAGRYRVSGRISGGASIRAITVSVKRGRKVRQDLFEPVP